MLDVAMKDQLKPYLDNLVRPVILVAFLDESAHSIRIRQLLNQIAALSAKTQLIERQDTKCRTPSFSVTSSIEHANLIFSGLPLGLHFTSLVLAILQTGGYTLKEEQALVDRARRLNGTYKFETYFAQDCHSCPETIQALNTLTVINPSVSHTAIDGALFPGEVEQRQIRHVPQIYLNGEYLGSGRMGLEQLLDMISQSKEQNERA